MKKIWFLFLLFLISCQKRENSTISVFAAVGASEPLLEIIQQIEERESIRIEANFASSGTLANQIVQGAQADVFVSANKKWIDFLSDKGLLIDSTVSSVGANTLVLVAADPNGLSSIRFVEDFDPTFFKDKTIAIGDPAYVPAGQYAKQALENLGWYEKLENQLILAKDVSAALRYVELKEADFGIVYRTECKKSSKIRTTALIPFNLYEPIVFYAALTIDPSPGAEHVLQRIINEDAIFEKHGFSTEAYELF